jgi:hypothetical protein
MGLNEKFFKSAAGGITPSDNFEPVIYTGNGGTNPITGVGFKPDLVWAKSRTSANFHYITDSVRGVQKVIYSNATNAEDADPNGLSSFNSNGFTVGASGGWNGANDYVAWNWRAAGFANAFNVLEGGTVTTSSSAATAGITAGTITTGWNVSANRDAGFSIVKYTGSTGNTSFGTGLTSEAEFIIFKRYTNAQNWFVFVKINNVWYYLEGLNNTNAAINYSASMSATSTTVNLPSINEFNQDTSSSYLAYCFHSVVGYSKIGSYTWTNASYTAGTMVTNLGFTPRFVMIKRTNGLGNWQMYDSSRGATSGTQQRYALYADTSDQEVTTDYQSIGFDSDGFSAIVGAGNNPTGGGGLNENGGQYIYLAIA